VAPSLGVELRPVNVRDADEIERSIAGFAQSSNGGLVVTGSPAAAARRDLITALAARHRLPAVYTPPGPEPMIARAAAEAPASERHRHHADG
jgi:putative tryptophan/tyrosine transport system substrate-binding protein